MVDILDLKHPAPEPEPEPQETPEESVPDEVPLELRTISWKITHLLSPREQMREYALMGGVAVVGGAVAWWQSSWLTLIVVALGIAALELHNRSSPTHEVSINHKGVTIDGYRHEYKHLHSFDVHKMPDGSVHLSLKSKRWHIPHMHLPIHEEDPAQVYAVLSQHLLEDEHRIPVIDYLIKK